MAGMSLAQQVEAWNHEHPVDSKVVVVRDSGRKGIAVAVALSEFATEFYQSEKKGAKDES